MLASLSCAPGGWLAVIGRAASPSEKTARPHIVSRLRDEVKRALRSALACAPPAPGAAPLGTARSWRGIVPFTLTHLAREGRMTVTIGRRELLVALGGAAVSWPLAARAQERVRRLAALIAYTEDNAEAQRWVAVFRDGLQQLGWVDGRNLRIDYRWGGIDMNTLHRFAKEIVAANPDVIFSSGSPTTRMLKQETRTIPIVFRNLVDPVGQGFVASQARPGGNVTGFVNLEP